jgi:hypothetical protein
MRSRWLLEAGGASLLLLLPYFCPLVMPDHLSLFHHHFPLRNVIGGFLLDLFGLFVLAVVSLNVLAKLPSTPRRIVGASIAGLFVWRTVSLGMFLLSQWYAGQLDNPFVMRRVSLLDPLIEYWPKCSHFTLAIIVLVFVILANLRPRTSRAVVNAVRVGMAGFAFCALWMIPELLFIGFGNAGVPDFDHSSKALARTGSVPKNRIVWILFDELSYDLIFDHPIAGQQYPNFQRLRSHGTSLTNIVPMGSFTDRVIPSLLAGQELTGTRSTLHGKSLSWDSKIGKEVVYDPNRTLFGEAKRDGFNPGVAGWYNPYCRIFVNVLTTCSWVSGVHTMLLFEQGGASENQSVLSNSLVLPRLLFRRISGTADLSDAEFRKYDLRDFLYVMARARELIRNEKIQFAFIHLPVPHPPGFYSRVTHQFSENGNYFDNLVLADDTLGSLMQEIENTSSAVNTTVVVSSDHSWRVSVWKNNPGWTQEEKDVSQGGVDPRPVFIVHFPGQLSGHEVSDPRQELIGHDIIESMLKGKVESPDELDALLKSSASYDVVAH